MGIRLLGGDYPQYEAILPKDTDFKVEVDREEFLEAIRGAVIFARDSANIIKLALKKGAIEVSANAPQIGENLIEVETESEKAMEERVAFNGKYLIDFLTHSQAARVGMGLSGALKPGLFYEVGNLSYKHVIMPVRVRE